MPNDDKQMSLSEWLVAFEANKDKNDCRTACELGFYDWFCKDTSLMGKIRRMAPLVKAVAKSPKINPDKVYVFFKNNCPGSGGLYDSFSICHLDEENDGVIYWISPFCTHSGQAELVTAPDFGKPIEGVDTVAKIKAWFKAA